MRVCLAIIFALTLFACKPQKEDPSPIGYNFNKKEKLNMRESLLEISGLTILPDKEQTILAINDEQGKVYAFSWDEKPRTVKFARGGDYEDITLMNDIVYILRSNGRIYHFRMTDDDDVDATLWKKILPRGEYESLFADTVTGKLFVLCKQCDESEGEVQGYILDPTDSTSPDIESFTISLKGNSKLPEKVVENFSPSALARHPLTKHWYVLSSARKYLLVFNHDWELLEGVPLSSFTFNQPEGITFDSEGNLYISNEGDDLFNGNILRFAYHKRKAKLTPF